MQREVDIHDWQERRGKKVELDLFYLHYIYFENKFQELLLQLIVWLHFHLFKNVICSHTVLSKWDGIYIVFRQSLTFVKLNPDMS